MTIDELRQKLEDACEYAIKERYLRITPSSFGVIDGEPTGSGCVCPIGALELYTKTRRGKLGSDWGFNYDVIANGFDLCEWSAPTEKFDRELYELGVDLRKKFYNSLSVHS
jgi:hypothetical protein